jgi:hypothetical protein
MDDRVCFQEKSALPGILRQLRYYRHNSKLYKWSWVWTKTKLTSKCMIFLWRLTVIETAVKLSAFNVPKSTLIFHKRLLLDPILSQFNPVLTIHTLFPLNPHWYLSLHKPPSMPPPLGLPKQHFVWVEKLFFFVTHFLNLSALTLTYFLITLKKIIL